MENDWIAGVHDSGRLVVAVCVTLLNEQVAWPGGVCVEGAKRPSFLPVGVNFLSSRSNSLSTRHRLERENYETARSTCSCSFYC